MIRKATLQDLPQIVAMAYEFVTEAEIDRHIQVDETSFIEWASMALFESHFGVFIAEEEGEPVGFIAGVLAPHFLNSSVITASELAWWVNPTYRGQHGKSLLNAFELWASTAGASIVNMAAIEGLGSKTLDVVYRRKGYILKEHTYTKEI